MQSVTFSLNISQSQYLRYYQGSAKSVVVRGDDGRRVQFPASALQAYVSREGVQGRFCLNFDEQNKFVSLKRI